MASNRIEIVKELRALEQHCAFKVVRSGEEQERFLRDYVADLQEFPLEAIQKACAKWRLSGATKFPTSGQLIPIIRECLPTHAAPRVETWRPLEPSEYEQLSVRDKIRHHRILMNEARRKAGPMWIDGKPAEAAEMPDTWHAWSRRAEGHADEIARLKKFTQPHPVAAE